MTRCRTIVMASAGLAFAAVHLFAVDNEPRTADQLNQVVQAAKVSMSDAIRTAENHAKGKAVNVSICSRGDLKPEMETRKETEPRKGADADRPGKVDVLPGSHPVYDVTILANNRFSTVTVCAETGQVVGQNDLGATFEVGSRGPSSTAALAGFQAPQSGSTRQDMSFMAPKRWMKSSDLVGKSVENPQNEGLGKIENLAIDPQSGRIIYGVLSYGGILGIGDKLFAIPWSALDLSRNGKEHFVLAVDKDRLKNAEGFDKSNWPNFADERWATDTHKYYDQPPYWKPEYKSEASADPRTRWYRPTSAWQKSTDLTGKNALSATNSEDLGELEELIIDPDSGRVIYGVLDHKGRFYAIPWSKWEMGPGMKDVKVAVTADQIKNAPHVFDKSKYPELTDQRISREIYTFYGEPLYWEVSSAP